MDWDDALVLDESRPRSCRIPPGTTHVEFGNPSERPVDRTRLLDVLVEQDNRLGVNVKKADVEAIAKANPRLAVCNGSVCYVHGRQCDEAEYHRV